MIVEPPVDYDEVVADSEEEEGEEMHVAGAFEAGGKRLVSSASAFTTTNMETPNRGLSSISEFTAGPSRRKLDDISPGLTSPNRAGDTSFEGTMSIADRAKTRQRIQAKRKAPEISGDIIELTSEDDDEPVPNSSKSKSRSKPQAKTTKSNNNETTSSSHEAELDAEVVKKPRPRPRPTTNKRQRTDTDVVIPPHEYPSGKNSYLDGLIVPQPPPTPPPASSQFHGAELPIATSPPRAMYSQLPPSDPPNPTMTTAYEGESGWQPLDTGVPPIEILQNADSDHDERASSPSSLFSQRRTRKNRKPRERPSHDMEVDELASSPPADAYMAPPKRDPQTARQASPPPTFFAGSSSMGLPPASPAAVAAPIPEVVDLTDLPPTFLPMVSDKVKPKAKKSKKKAVPNGDEFESNPGPMIVLDEDDKDDDFDPSGEGGKKAKGKGKQKEKRPKEKKQKGKKVQVEVVIPTKAKGKGKQKEAKEAEVFKSNEFVDDEDEDDADPLRLVGGEDGLTGRMRDDSPSTILVRPPRLSAEKPDKDPCPPTLTSGPLKGGAKSKKLPTQEDDEEKYGAQADEPIPVKKPRKPRKKATPAAKNDQTTVHEPGLDVAASTTAQVKISTEMIASKRQSKIITSGDEQGEDDTVDKPVVSEPTSSLEKENELPPTPLKHVASTPKPPSSRAPSVRPDGTTPLYSRYEVAPRRGSLSMTELIRRASSKPCSPFPAPASTPSLKDKSKSKSARTDPDPVGSPAPLHSTYSPYLKSSRRLLSRIAPLHPNRKTPPPPPPPPPPRKKTKKELEREEKWEEELVDEVGGIEAFAAMEESERKELRRAKREREMCGYDD